MSKLLKPRNMEAFPWWIRSTRNHAMLISAAFCVAALSVVQGHNLVQNGDFTANAAAFLTYPGYVGQAGNPTNITGWTHIDGGNVGVNGAAAVNNLGKLIAAHVIARPHDDLTSLLPK
jgi:hypothetical protein